MELLVDEHGRITLPPALLLEGGWLVGEKLRFGFLHDGTVSVAPKTPGAKTARLSRAPDPATEER